jgi:YVTN family beta-propeller protein
LTRNLLLRRFCSNSSKKMGKKGKVCLVAILLTIILLAAVSNTVSAEGVVARITVGDYPVSIAYDSGKGEIFVVNYWSDSISVISDSTNNVVATISIGSYPQGIAYDSGKGEIFVSDLGINTSKPTLTIRVISDINNSVIATIPGFYGNMAYDSGKGEIFVTNFSDKSVSVISDSTNAVVATIPLGFSPLDIVYDSGKGEIWVNNGDIDNSGIVSVISDTNNTVIATINLYAAASGHSKMAYDSGKGEIFVTNPFDGKVSVISDTTKTVVGTISVGSRPQGIAYDSAKGKIFVANGDSNTTSVISDSTNTVIATVNVDNPDGNMAYDSGKSEIFEICGTFNRETLVVTSSVVVISDSPDLTPASISVSANSIRQGQTSILTSVVTTGASPYAYQWFAENPESSNYSLIDNATSSDYSFATSASTVTGNWSFLLQVTDSTRTALNSTAITVTVNAALPPKFNEALIIALATVIMVVVLGAGLLVYFKKRKRYVRS